MKKDDYGNPYGLYLSPEDLKSTSSISDLSYRKSKGQELVYYETRSYLKPFNELLSQKISSVIGTKVFEEYDKAQSYQTPPLNLAQHLAKNDHILKAKQQFPDLFDQYNHVFKNMMQPCYVFCQLIGKTHKVFEIERIVNDFKVEYIKTTNLNFDVADKLQWINGFPKISCKENLIEISDDIFHKIKEYDQSEIKEQSVQSFIDDSLNSLPIAKEKQGMSELDKALLEIKTLKEANVAKDAKIKELEERDKKELIEFLNKKGDALEAKDSIINNLSENNNELKTHIEEIREDKKELRLEKNEWKAKYEAKDESLQKITEELANEKMKVGELGQKIAMLNIQNSDHNSVNSWDVMNQEENLHVIGEVAQEHNI